MFMIETDWHHAPLHRFVPNRIHMITGATLYKKHYFRSHAHLRLMQNLLLERLDDCGWQPRAWACLSNHYHVLALAPEENDLTKLVRGLHSKLSIALNKSEQMSGRKVMHQFWDRCITYENSYYARLNYVMNNPVKHGIIEDARNYAFCSARWFHENYSSSFRRKIASYPYDQVNEVDDF